MKVAVTSTGTDMESPIDPRFGRAAYFIVVDLDSSDFEVVENHQNLDLPQGAGIQAGTQVAETGAEVLITGHCGPKAFRVLQAAGVSIVTGAGGSIREAVSSFQDGQLVPVGQADVEGHWV